MISRLKITRALLAHAREDLSRAHGFALERVAFLSCRFARGVDGRLIVLAHNYYPVDDADYIDDKEFGALIGSAAFRKAMQIAYREEVGLFHVHLHDHEGTPFPSRTDLRETAAFVPDFFNVRPDLPHGALILSRDSISGRIWTSASQVPHDLTEVCLVGAPLAWIPAR